MTFVKFSVISVISTTIIMYILTPPIEVYPATNVRKIFVTTKSWQIFKLSHPITMGGGAETMYNQITCVFSKE